MDRPMSSLNRSTAILIAAGIVACATPSGDDGGPGRPTSSRLTFADEWSAAIHDMGRTPVYPPTEDVYVGDVFAFSAPPSFASVKSAAGLRAAATPRWSSLQVLPQLEDEYRQRPAWSPSTQPGAGESLYRADRVPVRHRIVGLRSMLKVTLQLPDLEPFIPIEIAPLIEGPATPARFGVSVQAGDAEVYSLSIDTVLEQLLDIADEPDGGGFTLKQEHLGNLSLVADPVTGKAYLVVLTEVLYMRSIEATVRKRDTPQAEAPAEGEQEQDAVETAEPATAAPAESGTEAPDEEARGVAAILRAEAMNQAFDEAGIEDRTGGTVQVVMATDDAITLRRNWPYPLAVAVRGITLEVDVSTGSVPRMSPLGIELPKLPEPEPEVGSEETELDQGS